MFGYIISFVAGALIGILGNKLFKKRGWGFGENIVAAGVAGLVGNYYLVTYFHSIDNRFLLFGLPGLIGATVIMSIIWFVYSYDNSEEY